MAKSRQRSSRTPSQPQFSEKQLQAAVQKAVAAEVEKANPAGPPVFRNVVDLSTNSSASFTKKPMSQVPFAVLRDFSVNYEIARMCINVRKRDITQLQWDILPVDAKDKSTTTIKQIAAAKTFFQKQLGGYKVKFRELQDTFIEDLMVLDALVAYKNTTFGGDLLNLTPVDGATIKMRVAVDGSTPIPPEVAYKQVIRGTVVEQFTADELIYEMMNPRSNSPYGLAPLESMILTVSAAIKSSVYNLNYLTEGNIPEGLFGVPKEWSSDQIKKYQELWDAVMSGDAAQTSKLRFVPDGSYMPTKKPTDMAFKDFQEWLMLVTCGMFDVSPQEIGFTMHQSTKANAGQQNDITIRKSILPLTNLLTEVWNDVLQEDMGLMNLKFSYLGLEDRDALAEAQANGELISTGQRTINEIRTGDGQDRYDDAMADKLWIPNTLMPVDAEAAQAKADAAAALASNLNDKPADTTPDPAPDNPADDGNSDGMPSNPPAEDSGTKSVDAELRKFRTMAINRTKSGKSIRPFQSDVLSAEVLKTLNDNLAVVKTADEARQVFDGFFRQSRSAHKSSTAQSLRKQFIY